MDTVSRLRKRLEERHWTKYRLHKESGLPQSTIANIFNRNSDPTITTLETICNAFGVTLSQFFAEQEMMELSPPLKELIDGWSSLSSEQKAAVLHIVKAMNQK